MRFSTLIGHACPEGRYPSVVLPVIRDEDGKVFVVYQGVDDGDRQLEPVSADSEYVRHEQSLQERLEEFHSEHHRLFAYAPQEVVFYGKGNEGDFFGDFLSAPNYRKVDPFQRMAFARLTRNTRHVFQEIGRCLVALKGTPEFLESWCEREMRTVLDSVEPEPDGGDRKKILLIEDHIPTAIAVQADLQEKGYSVTCANDGLHGLTLAVDLRPHIIVLDLHLPFIDGFEVFRRLMEYQGTKRIPVIVWSQFGDDWEKHAKGFPEVQRIGGRGELIDFERVRHVFLSKNRQDAAELLGRLVEGFSGALAA
jgi:CheY-like chemotaxis protein